MNKELVKIATESTFIADKNKLIQVASWRELEDRVSSKGKGLSRLLCMGKAPNGYGAL